MGGGVSGGGGGFLAIGANLPVRRRVQGLPRRGYGGRLGGRLGGRFAKMDQQQICQANCAVLSRCKQASAPHGKDHPNHQTGAPLMSLPAAMFFSAAMHELTM